VYCARNLVYAADYTYLGFENGGHSGLLYSRLYVGNGLQHSPVLQKYHKHTAKGKHATLDWDLPHTLTRLSDVTHRSGKEFLDEVEIRRVRRQVQYFDSRVMHLLDLI
jgi:hypothetical protein